MRRRDWEGGGRGKFTLGREIVRSTAPARGHHHCTAHSVRDAALHELVRDQAIRLHPDHAGDVVLDAIDPGATVVLIGEASHGTHEFYRIRADLTRALIERRGFNLVAVEADWPDAYRVNQWVRGLGDDQSADASLEDFTRFPRWMWRNYEVVRFLRWLHDKNSCRPSSARIGFYGLDLYSLHRSMARVIEYLDTVDPGAAGRARRGYACFDAYGEDAQSYGYAASLNLSRSCEDEAIQQLVHLQHSAAEYAARDAHLSPDAYFVAEQNARVVRNAEIYYRAMFRGGADSWNVRDRHMMDTLDALVAHATLDDARAVVWAHNSHLGNAAATSMADHGELNLGQLVRERYGTVCYAIGQTTHEGTVTATHEWDDPAALRAVRPSMAGSYERAFHDAGVPNFLLAFASPDVRAALRGPRLERAIGVIYRPETERASHYFSARLTEQFDAIVHVDRTRGLEPLERWARHDIDLPETYPTGV